MSLKQIILIQILTLLTLCSHLVGQPQSVSKYIASYVEEHGFSGSILIQNHHKIIYRESFGLANRQFNIPNTNKTKYKIASITKLFTAVLILQLYEQGKIDLHKTIKTYLPEYNGDAAERVTIHELLNHTSGMVNIDTISSQESAIKNGIPIYQSPYTTDDFITKYCSKPLINEPGKVFNYNNAEYIILGKIIEVIYNKPYQEVLKEKILDPLKMDNSGLLYQYHVIKDLADTYFMRNDLKVLVNDLPVYSENWFASGAMYSTTDNLLKFSNALFEFKLLKKETLNLMLTPGLDNYGYSVWVDNVAVDNENYVVIKRPGRIMGANSMLYHFLNSGLTIIMLANTDTANLDNFVLELGKRLVK